MMLAVIFGHPFRSRRMRAACRPGRQRLHCPVQSGRIGQRMNYRKQTTRM